jgi:hypothetical protein
MAKVQKLADSEWPFYLAEVRTCIYRMCLLALEDTDVGTNALHEARQVFCMLSCSGARSAIPLCTGLASRARHGGAKARIINRDFLTIYAVRRVGSETTAVHSARTVQLFP